MFQPWKLKLITLGTKFFFLRLLFLFFCATVLFGCETTGRFVDYFKGDDDDAELPAPLVQFKPRIGIVELWKKNSGRGTDEQYLKLAPVIANQRLYIVDSRGQLAAMDATNGRSLWRKKIRVTETVDGKAGWFKGGDIRITGGPGYGEKSIMVGTEEGEIITLSSEDGSELWRSQVSSEILSSPQRAGNVVVIRTIDGKVYGMDGTGGKRRWIYDRTVPSLTLRGTSTPVITDGVVVAGFDGGKTAALDVRTGKLIWETSVATARGRSELERMVDIDSEPVVVEGVVYIATFQGHIAAIQLDSGRILWSRDLSSHAGFGADEKNIYVTDENSHIWALDRFSGTTLWKQEDLHARAITAPGVIGDHIMVGDLEGYLHWMDKKSGEFSARTRLSDEAIIAKPVVVGKVAYAYCSDGSLAAYTYR